VAQGEGLEFKPLYAKKKKKEGTQSFRKIKSPRSDSTGVQNHNAELGKACLEILPAYIYKDILSGRRQRGQRTEASECHCLFKGGRLCLLPQKAFTHDLT
jgi:hypothetical protein